MHNRSFSRGLGGLLLAGGLVAAGSSGAGAFAPDASGAHLTGVVSASASAAHRGGGPRTVHTRLRSLNNSGAYGRATVRVHGKKATVHIMAFGLMRNVPHAAHLHFSPNISHRCPTNNQDANGDHRLTVTEGSASYGAIAASLTTKGDTSPASALAVDRFPTTPKGVESYTRTITLSSFKIAKAIKKGRAVLVIHGLDYNGNGVCDAGTTGMSDIAPTLPAEATDPALCGTLH